MAGAEVVGADRGPAADYDRSLAAGVVVDAARDDFAGMGRSFDLVPDAVGGDELQRRALAVLRARGGSCRRSRHPTSRPRSGWACRRASSWCT